jgi:glycosyltransferase involved in cell wall biosynthesis
MPLPEDPCVALSVAGLSPYLLFFGRLSRFKGAALLAEAAPALLREVPDFRLVVAGPDGGSEDLLLDLQRAFPDRVRCLGVLPPEKLRPLIKNARAVVLPSLMDNLPNACLEAMSLGRAVIGPDGVSFDELLVDGDSGVLFRLGDVASLQRAVVRVWNMSEEARMRMGQKARSHIVAALAPHKTSQDLESFYGEVIKRHAGRTRR